MNSLFVLLLKVVNCLWVFIFFSLKFLIEFGLLIDESLVIMSDCWLKRIDLQTEFLYRLFMIVSDEDLLFELLLQVFYELTHVEFNKVVTAFFNLDFEMQQIFEVILLVNSKMSNLWIESYSILVMKMIVCLRFAYLVGLLIVVNIKSTKITSVS